MCGPLILVSGAGVVEAGLLHRVWVLLPEYSQLDRLLVSCSRVVMATWHLVTGISRMVVMTVPLNMWGRVGRQHLCTCWVPLRFKLREFPGPESSGEVLGIIEVRGTEAFPAA